jgi:amino acid adenylation domain-containing protein
MTRTRSVTVVDLFTRQARETPEAIALVDGAVRYSYGDLDELTNRLARLLRVQGAGREGVVGCHLARSSNIVVFCLSVLKAGAAYLLLDPQLPTERLQFMVSDAAPVLVLSDEDPSGFAGRRVVRTEDALTASRSSPASALSARPQPWDLAYVAYTSGSTGRPKGVLIPHGAILNHTEHFAARFRLGPADVVPLMAPIAFDVATEEMLPALLSGCRLVVAQSSYESMSDLTEEIAEHGYTILNIPAPLWHEWSAFMCGHEVPIPRSLRLIITGSDKVHTSSFTEWLQLPGAGNVQWAAAYGTTETAVTSTLYLTAATDDLSGEPYIPIGTPIANTAAYVLDENGEPVADGEVGELHIGGAGLARGYQNLPDRTAVSFVPDHLSGPSRARLYRTGDLARIRPDGNIVWVGRKDLQVKYKGLRIEPGEIEAALLSFPRIVQAAVLLEQTGVLENTKHLVGYIATADRVPPAEADLRAFLYGRLPELMVPRSVLWMRRLPTNASGKIDREQLLAPT